MSDKSQTLLRRLPRAIGRHAMIIMRALVKVMPLLIYKAVRWILIAITRPFMGSKFKVIRSNLQMAYKGELLEKDINAIAEECFWNAGREIVDMVYFADRPEVLKSNTVFEGKEHLDKVLEEGKGAILVGGHFGNFILMYMIMALFGYKTNVIMKRVRDKKLEEYITKFRDERGVQTIYDLPARKCVTQCIKALRSNEILFILIDQNYGSEGRVFVDFFGKPAATATGPIVFGQRTQSPILPIFIQNNGDLKHKITIEPPEPINMEGDEQTILTQNMANLTQILESQIRKNPTEWGGWMHKRWKTQQ